MSQAEQHDHQAAVQLQAAPCPFCAGAPAADFIIGASYAIKCSACRARTTYLASASAAVAARNRRAVSPSPPPARVSNEDYALMVKRYENAGDHQNADIIRKQWEVARAAGAAPVAGIIPISHEHEALSIMLWLYRRLPRCYGRPPHVELPIERLARHLGEDVTGCMAERGTVENKNKGNGVTDERP